MDKALVLSDEQLEQVVGGSGGDRNKSKVTVWNPQTNWLHQDFQQENSGSYVTQFIYSQNDQQNESHIEVQVDQQIQQN